MAYNGIKGNVVVEDLYIPEHYRINKPDFKYEKGWLDDNEKRKGNVHKYYEK